MTDHQFIDAARVRALTPMRPLIEALRTAFAQDFVAPDRAAYDLDSGASLLLMPAWRSGGNLGVKIATVFPQVRPAVRGTYLLLDGTTGAVRLMLDGAMLTARRTAAASALAADYLAREDARTLLIIGTGALCSHLVEAHSAVRSIDRVLIWGRDPEKARARVEELRAAGYPASADANLDEAIASADIVTAATLSTRPLIAGARVRPGTHVDLVGAFRPEMCEADPETFAKSRVYVDTVHGALTEAGDLLQAITAGTFDAKSIAGDLMGLCRGAVAGRGADADMVTLFKSVGTSLEDLVTAEVVYGTCG